MGGAMRAATLEGQYWPGGIFPAAGDRAEWAAQRIRDLDAAHTVGWYGEAAASIGLASGTAIETWPSIIGADLTQATVSKRPDYVSDQPAISVDDVGEALTAATPDFGTAGTACVFLACERASGMSAASRTGISWGRYYAGAGGWELFFHPTNDRVFVGAGTSTASAYRDAHFWGYGSGRHVYAFTIDSSLAAAAQINVWVDGVKLTPDVEGGNGMVGNFAAGSLMVGARDDGAGGLERPFNGQVFAGLAMQTIPSDAEIVTVSRALAVRAGIEI